MKQPSKFCNYSLYEWQQVPAVFFFQYGANEINGAKYVTYSLARQALGCLFKISAERGNAKLQKVG